MNFQRLTTRELREFENFSARFAKAAKKSGIEDVQSYYELLYRSAVWIHRQQDSVSPKVWVQGIAGGQGSGKSTFAGLLKLVLESVFDLRTLALSLDDFYLSYSDRQRLAEDVNPLLATRGVPGTHDVELMNEVINSICQGEETKIPRFDKATDDRRQIPEVFNSTIDVLIIEGWCIGAKPYGESEDDQSLLRFPINKLEVDEDAYGVWRNFVNEQLRSPGYQSLFRSLDALFYLAVPDWDAVLRWRSLQESRINSAVAITGSVKMPADHGGFQIVGRESRIMDKAGIERFIMFYERITRKMLRDMPDVADFTFNLNEAHQFVSVIEKP